MAGGGGGVQEGSLETPAATATREIKGEGLGCDCMLTLHRLRAAPQPPVEQPQSSLNRSSNYSVEEKELRNFTNSCCNIYYWIPCEGLRNMQIKKSHPNSHHCNIFVHKACAISCHLFTWNFSIKITVTSTQTSLTLSPCHCQPLTFHTA